MPVKNPLCNYSGSIQELQAGDTIVTTGGAGGTNPIIREYSANANWIKPLAANFWGVMVVAVGAGGGGGSGRRGAAGSSRGGGGAAGGGAFVTRLIRAANLPDPNYSIVVASGGTGGASQTVNDSNGIDGVSGGQTSFGNLVVAVGGTRGAGGIASGGSAGAGGANTNCTPARGPYSISGGSGGSGNAVSGNPGVNGLTGNTGGAGGGGGGGINSLNQAIGTGGNGASIWDVGVNSGVSLGGTTTGNRNGQDGINFANNLLYDVSVPTTLSMGVAGAGGACGDAAGTINGGNGGNGGRGAGGGGGGASTNGANSGAGGNGGAGLCFVVEYYGA